MKIVIAPDSFKGSLTAKEAAWAIQKGVHNIFPQADYQIIPMADGGEGTVEALVDATNGEFVTVDVKGPLQEEVSARYGVLGDRQTAVIELAEASGIQYVTNQTKDPFKATTFGTGQLIQHALDHDIRHFIIGLGGSATNDGGSGILVALGAKLVDSKGDILPLGGGSLGQLFKIDLTDIDSRLKKADFIIASDVTNPLLGDQGATAIFGPQKGVTSAIQPILENALTHYAKIIKQTINRDVTSWSGAGAAGGAGSVFLAFFNAVMRPGVELVAEQVQLASRAKNADYVFTGEGSLDGQTQYGKTPMGVIKVVKQVAPKVKVIGFAGQVNLDAQDLYQLGMTAMFSLTPGIITLEDAIEHAADYLTQTAENTARLLR